MARARVRAKPRLLGLSELAAAAGVGLPSMRQYHGLSTAARRSGEAVTGTKFSVPEPDYVVARSPLWLESTVRPWLAERDREALR